MKKAPLFVAGLIFALVAILHAARLCYYQVPVTVGTTEVPLIANAIGFVVATLLSIWMFCSLRTK